MGYRAAKLLHQLLHYPVALPLQRILVPPVRVVGRSSTDYRSVHDPAVIQAMHYIRCYACKGTKVEQVLDAVGMSRSNLEKRFKDEMGQNIHGFIHAEKLELAQSAGVNFTVDQRDLGDVRLPIAVLFYAVFRKEYDLTPKEYRDRFGEDMNR